MSPSGSIKLKNMAKEVEDVGDMGHTLAPPGSCEAIVGAMTAREFSECERTLKRKLDFRLMAVLTFVYILNFLDRTNIATADVAGIRVTLGITSTQYSTAVGILFVGYILMQIPSNMFLANFRPSLYLPACMALWGTISACTGAVQNASGLYATRFFLGFVEAAFFPGSVFLIATWYKRSEMGFRVAVLYSGSLIGNATSGLIGAGITRGLNGARGLPAWRWIFIIEGSITVAVAILSSFLLPDYPNNTRWLSTQERAVAEHRLLLDAGVPDVDDSSWGRGFTAAFKDGRTYLFAMMFLCAIVTSSTQNFFPAVVQTLGFSKIETLLLTVPPYLFAALVTVANNLSADYFRNSSYHVIWPFMLSIVGFALAAASLNTWVRYFAMFLFVAGGHGSNAVTVAWCQKTILRPRIKRAAVAAFAVAFGNSGQIWTPYLYSADDAPRYVLAMSVNAAFALAGVLLALFTRFILVRSNAKLEAAGLAMEHDTEEERLAMNANFRYVT